MMSDDHNLDDPIAGLASLPRETAVPAELAGRTVAALRAQGLLRGQASPKLRLRWLPAAAALLLIATGWFAHVFYSRVPSASSTGKQYLLLLRQGAMREHSANEEAALVREYSAWGESLGEKGAYVSSRKLEDDARLLTISSEQAGMSADATGTAGPIQGFFLIRTETLEDALRIARECPHLRYGGAIEVRPIAAT